jgi:hypothetical protein
MSIPTDKIWSGPGSGWIRIDGNWSKGFLSNFDSFVWFLPARERSMSNHMSSPVRTSIFLSEEDRKNKLLLSVRQSLRHFVPVERMKQLADPFYLLSHQSAEEKTELRASRALHAAETIVDLGTVNLFHQVLNLCFLKLISVVLWLERDSNSLKVSKYADGYWCKT